jgi:Ni/Fe-hydrogenase subunit HybB-like protein
MTRTFRVLLAILGVWALILIWRFASGIGAVSGLSDGYPWGIWIAFDVVTGTALACGGYAVAILAYILNKGQYHPLVRPALLTSALGYSMAALAIIIDVGRPWFIHRIPLRVGQWNLSSALLEVALCVMAYVIVLWIELAPAFLERFAKAESSALRSFANTSLRILKPLLLPIIAVGILLPTMHQSSLGTVMLVAGHKLHGLWFTGWIPLLFLISCIGMGYAVVVWESAVSSRAFGREREDEMLRSLSSAMVVVLAIFVVLRFATVIGEGKTAMMFTSGMYSVVFWIEMALFIVPMVMLASKRRLQSFSTILTASILIMLSGAMYRFDAYIVAYNPGPGWAYFPTIPELLITFGVIALEITLFIVIVKNFPILGGTRAARSAA